MSRYYYFAATLPSLAFSAQPPMKGAEFLERCRIHLTEGDFSVVSSARLLSKTDLPASPEPQGFLDGYYAWERSVRNALAILRAHRLGKSGDRWLRPAGRSDDAARAASAVFQASTPLEGEIALERERWAFIDGASANSVFELDSIIAYSLKIQILERLSGLVPEKGEAGYREACAAILGGAENSDSRGVR
ncbi:MAG: DUF2764 family protein [Rectinemataceae bacterium]|nr:DUF2764 family protein [Rectinemataceae bacterium]